LTDAYGVPKWSCSAGVNVATQTVGLYYPSQRDLSRREQELNDKEKESREHKPVLTSVSPGRGVCLIVISVHWVTYMCLMSLMYAIRDEYEDEESHWDMVLSASLHVVHCI